jgi:hypothetical protein
MSVNKFEEELFSIIPGIQAYQEVDEVEAKEMNQQDFYRNWVHKEKPCIVRGAIRHWPAIDKWKQKEFWKSTVDDFELDFYNHRNFNNSDRQNEGRRRETFHKIIDTIFQEGDELLSVPAEEIHRHNSYRELYKDLPGFPFLKNPRRARNLPEMRFFMYRGASTAWHYHRIDETLMCQIMGKKRVALLPPNIPNFSKTIDFLLNERQLEGAQLEPGFNYNPFVVEVREGDALYIPPSWFHAVAAMDMHIGCTLAYCWGSPWHKFGNFSNPLTRKVYADLLWPISRYTFALPFVAFSSWMAFLLYRLGGNNKK